MRGLWHRVQKELSSETRSAVPFAPKRGVDMFNPKKYKTKGYMHFDHRINIEKVESYVTDQDKVAKHSFLPFIFYISSFDKYIGKPNPTKNNHPIADKEREIMYAGHLDGFIYKYYAEQLNTRYNIITDKHKIDECSTAYRNNKKRHSNIEFAAEVINTTVNYEEAYILVGDFTKFFNKINHRLLKELLIEVLDVNKLSDDWYNIYRSITKYGYYEKSFLQTIPEIVNRINNKKHKSYFKNLREFRKFQRMHPCKYNREKCGIPQGSAISVVFANIYALYFDIAMRELSQQYDGIYRRYSDDFIIVIPKKSKNGTTSINEFKEIEKKIRDISDKNKIELQESKTELLAYRNKQIYRMNDSEKHHLDYLGFIFDGQTVKMRGKSPYKFYREAYKLIDYAKKIKYKKNLSKLPYRKQIYGLYTDLGIDRGEHGNFITYAKRAQKKFDEISPNTTNLMMNQIKNRKKKIEKRLGVRIHV